MTAKTGRVLAIDLGEVRVGLALSDELGITAQPAGFLERKGIRRNLEAIRRIVLERNVERIVVGHPLLLSGETGARAADAESFASQLRQALSGIPVELWDERLTTVEAERVLISGNVKRRRRREVIDSLAAVLILQGYLESRATRAGAT